MRYASLRFFGRRSCLRASGHKLPMKPNPAFAAQVKELIRPSDTLLVMCRSGGRGAQAVNMLAEMGFTHAYNVVDGMEGDVVEDPNSVFNGQRLKNGWKNSGLPWTYDPNPDKVRWPTTR